MWIIFFAHYSYYSTSKTIMFETHSLKKYIHICHKSIQDQALQTQETRFPELSCYCAYRAQRERERGGGSMAVHGTRAGGPTAVNGLSSESAVTHVRLMWLKLETCLQSQGLFNTYFTSTHTHSFNQQRSLHTSPAHNTRQWNSNQFSYFSVLYSWEIRVDFDEKVKDLFFYFYIFV